MSRAAVVFAPHRRLGSGRVRIVMDSAVSMWRLPALRCGGHGHRGVGRNVHVNLRVLGGRVCIGKIIAHEFYYSYIAFSLDMGSNEPNGDAVSRLLVHVTKLEASAI